MKKIFTLVAGATLLLNTAHASTYQGTWKTGFGTVDIQQRSGAFCGTYKSQGFVAGYTNGVFARGVFVHADQNTGKLDNKASNQGLFQWVKKEDGRFDGIWRWGTAVNMSSTKDWNGSRSKDRKPSGSQWRKYNGYCLGYIAQLPKDAKDWIEAAKRIDSSAIIASFSATNGSNDNATRPPARDNQNSQNNQYDRRTANLPRVRTTSGQQIRNCRMGDKYANALYCEIRAKSTHSWVDQAIDTRYCKPNSIFLPPDSYRIHCEAEVTGSFAHSCEVMHVRTLHLEGHSSNRGKNPADKMRYMTFCEGPKLQSVGKKDITTLTHTSTRETSYLKRPHKSYDTDVFGNIPRNRYYSNKWNVTTCESARFWNEGGYLRCSE